MAKKGDKILTRNRVEKLGLDKVSVITADMLAGFTGIGDSAFAGCKNLESIDIPDSVISIGNNAFACTSLTSVIIPNSVISIGYDAFIWCLYLTSIEIPNSVTRIGKRAFRCCNSLTSITIGNNMYKKHEITDGKCKAYKAFNSDMICRNFQYEEGKTYKLDRKPKLCERGFHACLNLSDVFNYYWGKLGKDIIIHEVKLEGVSNERHGDSKVVAKKITIGKRIL